VAFSSDSNQNSSWWGEYRIPLNQLKQISIGSLSVYLQRYENEWQAVHSLMNMEEEKNSIQCEFADADTLPLGAEIERKAFARTTETVRIRPMIPPRPIVSSPVSPFKVPPKQSITIFISLPVWVRFEVGHPPVTLIETWTQKLSDTWFGPSSQQGELCYANKTSCCLRLDDIDFKTNRAITPVTIHNQSQETIHLKKISMPVTNLSIFTNEKKQLWTSPVKVEMLKSDETVNVKIEEKFPSFAGKSIILEKPRKDLQEGAMTRAISAIFS